MAPAGLGRRGERQGFAGRPSGRTSGRPWPQRGCGTRRVDEASPRTAWGDARGAAFGRCVRIWRLVARLDGGLSGAGGGRPSKATQEAEALRVSCTRRGLRPLRAGRPDQSCLPLLGSPNRKVREYAPLLRTRAAFRSAHASGVKGTESDSHPACNVAFGRCVPMWRLVARLDGPPDFESREGLPHVTGAGVAGQRSHGWRSADSIE